VQRISIKHLCPGMITARNVFNADGRILIGTDRELSEKYIERLSQLGVLAVYIHNPYFEDAIPPEIISENSRVRLIQAVQQQFIAIREDKKWNIEQLKACAQQIVTEVEQNRHTLIQLTDIRPHNEFTFGHSVNVAVLCVIIGLALQYPKQKLLEIALGGLLHDIGKMKIPTAILNKPDKLTAEEYLVMQTHAQLGFEILRKNVSNTIPLRVMHMAFQHQEKPDGTGYPRHLCNEEIHEYAKVVSVADVYDAVTCDRPYHRGLFTHEAVLLLAEEMGRQFDANILTSFLTRVALYSVGSVVKLSTGEIGVVAEVPWGMQNRPLICLMLDKYHRLLKTKTILDLREHPLVDIVCAFDEEAVIDLTKAAMRKAM
jgi:HD-GYP domain-containing protein (c-di-GMP phosphodiesterase class II)